MSKHILFTLSCIIAIISIWLNGKQIQGHPLSGSMEQIGLKQENHKELPDDKEILCLLQGTWWAKENDPNALFSIKGDSLYYADMPDIAPIKIEISQGTLKWKTEVPINWEIIAISPKRLKYYDHFNSVVNTMYKF